MREELEQRLEALKNEFEIGQAKLGRLDREQLVLRETLLRISGAIQVLEETLGVRDQGAENQDETLPNDNAKSFPSTGREHKDTT
jgi:predicted nuclease with TOPRIM domain